jgi:hypothetical protein
MVSLLLFCRLLHGSVVGDEWQVQSAVPTSAELPGSMVLGA